jgi:membrane protein involved in colicin uptake
MAYKMALATNEEVSAKIEVDRKANSEAERIAKAKKSAAAARRAGGTSIRATGTLPAGAAKAKSVDDFIGSLVDERMPA